MKTINFSYNWNNKLECSAFTTIRLENPSKYVIGDNYQINLKDEPKCTAVIVDIKPFYLSKINAFMSMIDTGYTPAVCTGIIEKMYSKVDLNVKPLWFILLAKQK